MLICENLFLQQGDFELRGDAVFAPGITAVMGPSGAGKSTLLGMIAGFTPLNAGVITFEGRDISGLSPSARPVSILFQDNNLFPHLSIAENVGLGLRGGLKLSAADDAKIAEVLQEVGLGDMGDRKPAALSGGQQSRAALARVLLGGRSIVLLDEPFAALGPRLKEEMLDLVRERLVPLGRTVVMVSHDPTDAKRIADRVCLVADGQIHAPLSTAELFDNPPDALRDYLSKMD